MRAFTRFISLCAFGLCALGPLAGCEAIVSQEAGTLGTSGSGGPGPSTSGTSAGATASGTSSGTSSGTATGTTSGTASLCGNGVIDPGEVCDLGDQNGQGLGCNATCNLLGQVTTIVGDGTVGNADGFGTAATIGRPYGLAVVGDFLYVTDLSYAALRSVALANGDYVQTLAGNHIADGSCLDGNGLSTDPDSGFCEPDALLPFDGGLLITDYGALRFFSFSPTLDGGALSTFGGQVAEDGAKVAGFDGGPLNACIYGDPHGLTQVGTDLFTNTFLEGIIAETSLATDTLTPVGSVGNIVPQGGMTALNGVVYTSVTEDPGALYAYDPATGTVSQTPDDGSSQAPGPLDSPDGLCTDGQSIYICETGTNEIRQYAVATGQLSLLAGGASNNTGAQLDGLGTQASFFDPAGCAWDPVRKVLYVSDRSGSTIRVIR